jgi:hypothetical protein
MGCLVLARLSGAERRALRGVGAAGCPPGARVGSSTGAGSGACWASAYSARARS